MAGPLLSLSGLLAALLVLVLGPDPNQTYWQSRFIYVGWVPGVLATGVAVWLSLGDRVGMMRLAALAGALFGAGAAVAGLQFASTAPCDSAWYLTITRMVPAAAGMSGAAALVGSWLVARALPRTATTCTRPVPERARASPLRVRAGLLGLTALLAGLVLALSGPRALPAAIGVTKCNGVTVRMADGSLATAAPSPVLAGLSRAEEADGWPANISGEADVRLTFRLPARSAVEIWGWYSDQSVYLSDLDAPGGKFVYRMPRMDFDRTIPFTLPSLGVGRLMEQRLATLPADLREGFYVVSLDGHCTLVPRVDLGDGGTLVLIGVSSPSSDTNELELTFARRSGLRYADSLADGLADAVLLVWPEYRYGATVDGEQLPVFWRAYAEGLAPAEPRIDAFPPVLHAGDFDPLRRVGGTLNSPGNELKPYISADGERLAFVYRPSTGGADQLGGVWLANTGDGLVDEPLYQVFPELGTSAVRSALIIGEHLWALAETGDGDTSLIKHRSSYRREWLPVGTPHLSSLDMHRPHGAWISAHEDLIIWAEEKDGGHGGHDLWMARRSADAWGPAINLGQAINSSDDERSPFVSPDGSELWYTGTSRLGEGTAIFRSRLLQSGAWGPPQEVLAGNCSDPSVDAEGNLYFAHLIISGPGQPAQSDIYLAPRARR